ncbi:phage portal protein [Jiella pelagia]|uniref:Phage portal protein n=1 Tax=Jiella pelagia TaxID=2986949 RepID=A0ABY7C062_9HYPH|nr:phage portal protein [Jiella pelagia]WAP69047.1 phage portal protein [Jiella pelagia]
MNALDRVIGFISPESGLKRARARAAYQVVRNYEGGSVGRRTEGWRAVGSSADASASGSLSILRYRSRDLTRNNPYAQAALRVIANNVVGDGIEAQASQGGKRQNRADAVMKAWKAWSRSTNCDAEGRKNFYVMQSLVMRTVAESGECFVRRYYRGSSSGLDLKMQVQVLEPDYLDTSRTDFSGTRDGAGTFNGIKYDKNGKILGYYFFKEHPGDNKGTVAVESVYVAAKDVLHIFREDRPGQSRGVPWCAPVIIRMRNFDEYEDAQLMIQKVSACFGAFYSEDNPLPGGQRPGAIPDTLEPGGITVMPAGGKIEFAEPPVVDAFKDYAQVSLRSIAVGYGVTYEAITGDLSGVNFSSGRMGWIEFSRNVNAWRWNMLIPQFCQGIWDWFVEALALTQGQSIVDGVTVQWTPPRREMINPKEEIAATVDAVRSGLQSLPEALRERGFDPDEVFREIAETNEKLDKLKLSLESDPRRLTRQGQAQVTDVDNTGVNANGEQ